MIRNNRVGSRQRWWKYITRLSFIFSATIVFFSVMAATPALGQSTSWYSDAWGDDLYLYGSGTSESSYNYWSHEFRVVSTMTSPNGRTATYDTAYSSATAYVSLDFDENDTGFYDVNSIHYDYCPMANQEIYYGSSYARVRVGVSVICNSFRGIDPNEPINKCHYEPVEGCLVNCVPRSGNNGPMQNGICLLFAQERRRWTQREGGGVQCPQAGVTYYSNTNCYDCLEIVGPYQ